jgi:hypothetical protein
MHPTGFPNLADETGPVILTQGNLDKYRREQLDRVRAENHSLDAQRQELERLIRKHDTKMKLLYIASAEHQWHPEEAHRAASNPI